MTDSATCPTTITTTYLELASRSAFRPAAVSDQSLVLMEAHEASVGFYRFLYAAVGADVAWLDRRAWSDHRLANHLARAAVTVLVLYWRGTPAGYAELDAEAPEPGTELAYFGLVPSVRGRGFGKHLLSRSIERAYLDGASRIWLHTCTLDGPHAMANYLARGFVPYRTETHEAGGHGAMTAG